MSNNRLFVVAAPSGAGKTSLVRALIDSNDNVDVAVSHTTRQRRPGEVDGENYHFVDEPAFEAMIRADAFLEWARVFDNYYGTSRKEAEKLMTAGKNLILEIDWQGAAQIEKLMPATASVFILPPSLATLKERLESRAQDDPAIMAKRMNAAISEISHVNEFDYVIVNDDFADALADFQRIIRGDAPELSTANLSESTRALIASLLKDA